MALRTNGFEGVASGTTLTAENSGTSGSVFQSVATSGTYTGEFSNAQSLHGTQSLHISAGSGSTFYPMWTGMSGGSLALRFYIRFVSLPSESGAVIGQIRDTSSNTALTLASAIDGADKMLQVIPKSGGTQNIGHISTGVWYRIEAQLTKGTTSSNGQIHFAVYSGDDTDPISGYEYTTSAADVGTANFGQFRFGKMSGSYSSEMYLDEAAVNDGTAMPIGPAGVNAKPIASAGADQVVEVESTVVLNGSDSDSDGTIESRQWTFVSYPGDDEPVLTDDDTANASFDADEPGRYVLEYVVTDDDEQDSDPDEVTIFVYPHADGDVSVFSDTPGAWTLAGSAPSTVAAVNDDDESTGVTSPDNPSGEEYTCVLNPIGPGDIRIGIEGVYFGAPVTRTVTLFKSDGATQVYTTTQAPASSVSELEVSLSPSALAMIPTVNDRKALVLKISSVVA